jgi:hypothetical protein
MMNENWCVPVAARGSLTRTDDTLMKVLREYLREPTSSGAANYTKERICDWVSQLVGSEEQMCKESCVLEPHAKVDGQYIGVLLSIKPGANFKSFYGSRGDYHVEYSFLFSVFTGEVLKLYNCCYGTAPECTRSRSIDANSSWVEIVSAYSGPDMYCSTSMELSRVFSQAL